MPYLARILTALVLGSLVMTNCLYAESDSPRITVGTQEIGLSAGYLFAHRLVEGKSKTKQSGPAFMPSWMITLTDPIGNSWYRGQYHTEARWSTSSFRNRWSRTALGSPQKSNTASSHLTGSIPMLNSPEALFGPTSQGIFLKSTASSTLS